jgi:hypothetical protein
MLVKNEYMKLKLIIPVIIVLMALNGRAADRIAADATQAAVQAAVNAAVDARGYAGSCQKVTKDRSQFVPGELAPPSP